MPTKQLFTSLSLEECRATLIYELPTDRHPIAIYPRVTQYTVPYLVLSADHHFDLYIIYPIPPTQKGLPNWFGIHGLLEATAAGTKITLSVKAPSVYFVDVVLEELVEIAQPLKPISRLLHFVYNSLEKSHALSFKKYNLFLFLLEGILKIDTSSKWLYQPLFAKQNHPTIPTVAAPGYHVLQLINQQAAELPRFSPIFGEIYHQLGEEVGPAVCQTLNCTHLTITHSHFCRAHHMANLLGKEGLFYFESQEYRVKFFGTHF